MNILEELDRPGEYYIDRREGKLYFWPPKQQGETVVSTVSGPRTDRSVVVWTFVSAAITGVQNTGIIHARIPAPLAEDLFKVGLPISGALTDRRR